MKRGNNYSGVRWAFRPNQTAHTDPNVIRFMDGSRTTLAGQCPEGGTHIFPDDQPCKKCGEPQ